MSEDRAAYALLPLSPEDEVRRLRLQESLDAEEIKRLQTPKENPVPYNLKSVRAARYEGRPTEEQFLQQVKQLAQVCGYRVYHARWSVGSDAGWPDLTLVRPWSPERGWRPHGSDLLPMPSRLIFAELKVRAKVMPAQQAWLDDLKAAGQEAYLFTWREGILDEIAGILRR